MIFEEKTIILKDGRTAILKSPCVEDAEKLLNYIKKSCSETDFLARYPEEWTTTIGQEEAWVNRLRSAPDTLGIGSADERKGEQTMRKIICVILALFLASSAAFAGYQIFREYTERQESADTYTDLENLISFPEVLPEEEPDETKVSFTV